MKASVQKWGNSLAVRIPKLFAEELGFADNSRAEMILENGTIILKPDRERTFDLESLLSAMTDENIHPAWAEGWAANTEETAAGVEDRGGSGRSGGAVR
jgi:antitoxin MazE